MASSPTVIDAANEITPEWVASVLAASGTDVSVTGVVSAPVGTGQMGATHRVAADVEGADEPLRLVVKLPVAPGVASMSTLGQRCEVGFYREAASRVSIGMPGCQFAAHLDDGTRFTIVLEDVAPATPGNQIAGCTTEQALAAAVNLGGLHAPTWCDPSIEAFDWLTSGRMDDGAAEFFGALVVDATAKFVDSLQPSDEIARVLRRFAGVAAHWAGGRPTPFALTHGDYRLDNLMFPPADRVDDPVIALDWGVVSVGVPQRDLALLLAPGLDAEVRRPVERAVVDAYHARLVELGVTDYDADDCWEDYRYSLFYPLTVTALGWAYSNRSERGDHMFLTMVDRSVSAILDHDPFALL